MLRERPDSQVSEVLFVPRCSSGRIVGVVPVDSPIVGHLAMARLAGGHVEMVNVGVMTLQVSMSCVCVFRRGGRGFVFRAPLVIDAQLCIVELGVLPVLVVQGGACD